MSIQEIRDQQGWNDDSMLRLACAFILEQGLIKEFEQYLQETADDENQQAGE